jgi:replicative DNA helicase
VFLENYMALVAANGREKRLADGMRIIYASQEEAMPQLEALIDRERQSMKPTGNDNRLGEQISAFIDSLANPDETQRIKTGIPTLDGHTGGLPKKTISIVGARPGVGKTDIMLNWSNRALDDLHTVLIFSLEMPVEQLLERYAAAMARVNYSLINQRRVKAQAGEIGAKLVDLMKGDRLRIVDDVNCITGIISEIARVKPDIAFIDYMGIVEPERNYRDARHREIAEITRAIKKAAKKYGCHICVLAQLTRDAQDREPTKSDLREAGAQEEQFDIVMLLHRPPFYKPDAKYPTDHSKGIGDDIAVLIMDKNKYGAVARLKLKFDGAHQQFTEAAKEDRYDGNRAHREPGEE